MKNCLVSFVEQYGAKPTAAVIGLSTRCVGKVVQRIMF